MAHGGSRLLVLPLLVALMIGFCRAEFSDIDFELTITDTAGNVVYKDDPYILQSIAWVWKELVVLSASKKEETKTILAEIEHLKLKEEVYEYLQREAGENCINSVVPLLMPATFSRKGTS